jgi:hypothetical protein
MNSPTPITWHYAPKFHLLEIHYPDGRIATLQNEDADELADRLDEMTEPEEQSTLWDYAHLAVFDG